MLTKRIRSLNRKHTITGRIKISTKVEIFIHTFSTGQIWNLGRSLNHYKRCDKIVIYYR